jgi:L-fuculose-phosphate aldolase
MDGNISVRADEGTALITPSGVSKAELTGDMLVSMKLSGEIISGGKPSSEASMHLAVYRARSDVGAVIHAHSPNIGAFALSGKRIDTRCAPFAYFHLGVIGEVPYLTPGSVELHNAVEKKAREGHNSFILYGHGSLALGHNIEDAFARMDLYEAFAEMLIKAEALGGVNPLSDEELAKIAGG